jgi:hypothetical protein
VTYVEAASQEGSWRGRGFREGQVSAATNTFIVSRSDDQSGRNRSVDKGTGAQHHKSSQADLLRTHGSVKASRR